MATVYLHIGMPKTGTTALQYFMWNNNDALQKYQIHFPHFAFCYTRVGYYRNAHFLIEPRVDKKGKNTYNEPCEDYEAGLDELKRLGESYEKLVLSDEGIYRLSLNRPNFWSRLKKDLKKRGLGMQVIVYLRRQDLWLEGYWAQKIKEGSPERFDEFLEEYWGKTQLFDYYAYMKQLESAVGRENLHVRVYEKGQFRGAEGNLYSDFLDIFGLSLTDEFILKKEVRNERFDGAYLEFRRVLNTLPETADGRKVIQKSIRMAQEYAPEGQVQKTSYFHPQKRKEFLSRFEQSNSKVAQEFFGREDGRLFCDPVEELPEFAVSDRELFETALCVYRRAMEQLLKENRKLKQLLEERADGGVSGDAADLPDISDEDPNAERVEMEEHVKTADSDLQKLKKDFQKSQENSQENSGWNRLKKQAKKLLGEGRH